MAGCRWQAGDASVLCRGWSVTCGGWAGYRWQAGDASVLCRGWSATCSGWAGCRWQAGDASVLCRGWLVTCGGCGRMSVAGRGCFGALPGMVSAGCLAVVVVSPHSRSPSCRSTRPPCSTPSHLPLLSFPGNAFACPLPHSRSPSCRSTRPPPRSSAPPAKCRGEYARIYPNLRHGEAVECYVGPVSPKGRGKNCRKFPNLRRGEAVEGYVGEVPSKGRGKNCRKFPNLRRGIICGDVRGRRFFGAESCLIFCTEKAGLPNKMVLQGHSVRGNRGLPNGIALMAKVARREPSGPCRVGAESPEKAHTWTGQRPQTGQQATGREGRAGGRAGWERNRRNRLTPGRGNGHRRGCRAGRRAGWERNRRKRITPGRGNGFRRGSRAGRRARWERKRRKRLTPRRGNGFRRGRRAGRRAGWERNRRNRFTPGRGNGHRRGCRAGRRAGWERKCRKRLTPGRGSRAQGAAASHGPGRQGSFRQITIFAA